MSFWRRRLVDLQLEIVGFLLQRFAGLVVNHGWFSVSDYGKRVRRTRGSLDAALHHLIGERRPAPSRPRWRETPRGIPKARSATNAPARRSRRFVPDIAPTAKSPRMRPIAASGALRRISAVIAGINPASANPIRNRSADKLPRRRDRTLAAISKSRPPPGRTRRTIDAPMSVMVGDPPNGRRRHHRREGAPPTWPTPA